MTFTEKSCQKPLTSPLGLLMATEAENCSLTYKFNFVANRIENMVRTGIQAKYIQHSIKILVNNLIYHLVDTKFSSTSLFTEKCCK